VRSSAVLKDFFRKLPDKAIIFVTV